MNGLNGIELAPPIEPFPVGMSYTGPGWIVVYILLALIILYIAIRMLIRYRKKSYRRRAIAAMQKVVPSQPTALIIAMSILKSTAMKSFGRSGIASLTGKELFDHFNQLYPAFDPQTTKLVSNAIYSDQKSMSLEDKKQFITQSQNWIRKHGV